MIRWLAVISISVLFVWFGVHSICAAWYQHGGGLTTYAETSSPWTGPSGERDVPESESQIKRRGYAEGIAMLCAGSFLVVAMLYRCRASAHLPLAP